MGFNKKFNDWIRSLLTPVFSVIAVIGILYFGWVVASEYVLTFIVMPHMPHSWRQIIAVPIAIGIALLAISFMKNVIHKK